MPLMTKFSDDDFNKIVAEFQSTTIGAALVKDHVAVTGRMTDAKGVVHEDHPTEDNAFVISTRQYEGPGNSAHTRIDIRGADGLIHTSYECDHIEHEPLDSVLGKTLLLDVVHFNTGEVVAAKGAVIGEAEIKAMRKAGNLKIPTKLRTAQEVAALLKPFLELDHEIHGTKITAAQLSALGSAKKAHIEARRKQKP